MQIIENQAIEGGEYENTLFKKCIFSREIKLERCSLENCTFTGNTVTLFMCSLYEAVFSKKEWQTHFTAKFCEFHRVKGDSNYTFSFNFCKLERVETTFKIKSLKHTTITKEDA